MTSQTPAEAGANRAGAALLLWAALILVLNAFPWLTGRKPAEIARAIEAGTARIEARTRGEVSDDAIRKAIRTQRNTYPFWRAMALIGDFALEPIAPALRAVAYATLLASLAALVGRPAGFGAALAGNARMQGWWVAGLAVAIFLPVALGKPGAESTAALALPPGKYPAAAGRGIRQADPFSAIGWLAMIRGAGRGARPTWSSRPWPPCCSHRSRPRSASCWGWSAGRPCT
ncbi:MAG: hypothetical protein U0800_24365 [Isosphaeraceae bacterium]